ncbi:MAG: YbaK/EbsC family protein [Spirochaetales bacterium]|nr:YbaK/EbsC family protein [Spirochaetales bacterium]
MAIDEVREYLRRFNRDRDIIELAASTATVAEAAAAMGVRPARIAKSLSLSAGSGALIVVTAGDMKLDNRKYKDYFGLKAKMLSSDEALNFTGHPVGGVCPFALPPGVAVYLDVSLKRFDTVFPACGSAHSAIELTPAELEALTPNSSWADLCRPLET